MRVTLLGHATILVEMGGTTCLMDPVFFDPFEEGAVVSCPKRNRLLRRRTWLVIPMCVSRTWPFRCRRWYEPTVDVVCVTLRVSPLLPM